MSAFLQDLKFGLRDLRKNPGFTVVAVFLLAGGIAACTAAFSLVEAVLLRPPPYLHPEQMVRLQEKKFGYRGSTSTLTYLDWARQSSVFSSIAAVAGESLTLTRDGAVEPLSGLRVTVGYFDVFGLHAALGRTFLAGEDQPGHAQVAVISHALWTTAFGADPAIVGRSYFLNGVACQIIGVLPAGPFDRGYPQLWRPLAFAPGNLTRNYHWLEVYARMKPGVTLGAARSQMDTIGARIAHDYPETNQEVGVAVDSYTSTLASPALRDSLCLLLAAVGAVLLIACFNLANLTLARGLDRERELAIRASLGASPTRLLRQLLTESALLTGGGAVLGIGLGYAAIRILAVIVPAKFLPAEAEIAVDPRILFLALGLAAVAGVIVGLLPAFRAMRRDVSHGLQSVSPGSTTSRPRQRLRSALIVAEVALAFMLLAAAGLLLRSFQKLRQVDIGYDPANVITASIPIPELRYSDGATLNAYLRRITDAVAALPGVREVALTSAGPMRRTYGMGFDIVGRPAADHAHRPSTYIKTVSPSYFHAIGLNLLRGRPLNANDVRGARRVAVINQAMARLYFPNEDALTKGLLVPEIMLGQTGLGADQVWEIVGVVADEKVGPLAEENFNPCVYLPTEQAPQIHQSLLVRAATAPALIEQAMTRAVYEIDHAQSLVNVATLEQQKSDSMLDHRLGAWLLGLFAAVALGLSAVGIYGLLAYAVIQRTRELGIRAALGATPRHLLRLVLRHGMKTVGLGLVLGLAGALAVTQFLSSLLFGVDPHDPLTLVAVAGVLAAVALFACARPAWRAAQVDPIETLKAE